MNNCEIVTKEKTVCGAATTYSLSRISDDSFEIRAVRENEDVSARFDGDFFEVIGLFKTIVDTDTLPDNLYDICDDFKKCALV